MNEVNKQIVKGFLVSKKKILENPNAYREKHMICLEVGEEYLQALVHFGTEVDLSKPLEVTMKPWPEEITERAKDFFFTLRDRVCKAMGDETRGHKDHLYRMCLQEYTAGKKKSIKELNKQELWQCTELMYQWCFENDAYIGDLLRERINIQKELTK